MPANQTAHQLTHQPTWTTERLELLKSGFEAGLSCREIAAHIGVSRNAVIGKISRMNLTRDKPGVRRPARKAAEPTHRPKTSATLRHFLLKAVPTEPEPMVKVLAMSPPLTVIVPPFVAVTVFSGWFPVSVS